MRHLTEETVQRLVKTELPPEERNKAVRHLLTRCPQCARMAQSAVAGEREELDSILDRLEVRPKEITERIRQERLLAARQWASLQKGSRAQRLARIDANPQMHTWGLYDTILEAARQTPAKRPRQAIEVADLALAVAMSLDKDTYGEGLIADSQAAALAARGNCKRIAEDVEGARADLEAAWKLLEKGTGDPLEKANLLSLRGSWNIRSGFFKEAERLLERAINIYRRAADDSMVGRTMVEQARAIGSHDPERAIPVLEEASGYINSVKEPWTELCLRNSLAWCLNDTGQSQKAAGVLEDSRWLYRKFRNPTIQFQLHWLESRINQNLGNLREAEEILKRTVADCLQRGLHQEYLRCGLELAMVVSAQGDRTLTLQILSSLYRLLGFWRMPTEKLFVFLLLISLLEQDDI